LHSHLTKMEIKFPFRSVRSLLQVQRVAVHPSPRGNEIASRYENVWQNRCAYPMRASGFIDVAEKRCSRGSRETDVRDRWNPLSIVGALEAVNPVLDFFQHGFPCPEKDN